MASSYTPFTGQAEIIQWAGNGVSDGLHGAIDWLDNSYQSARDLTAPYAGNSPFALTGDFLVGGGSTLLHALAEVPRAVTHPVQTIKGFGQTLANGVNWVVNSGDTPARHYIASSYNYFATTPARQIARNAGQVSATVAMVASPIKAAPGLRFMPTRNAGVDMAVRMRPAEGIPARQLVNFDGEFATQQLLGTTSTPGGRQIMFHAADRMVNPPKGRIPMSAAEIDDVLNGATRVVKRDYHPMGNTLTIENANMPGRPRVIVDEATGQRIITVINPKKR